jgi:hypothetical protein
MKLRLPSVGNLYVEAAAALADGRRVALLTDLGDGDWRDEEPCLELLRLAIEACRTSKPAEWDSLPSLLAARSDVRQPLSDLDVTVVRRMLVTERRRR